MSIELSATSAPMGVLGIPVVGTTTTTTSTSTSSNATHVSRILAERNSSVANSLDTLAPQIEAAASMPHETRESWTRNTPLRIIQSLLAFWFNFFIHTFTNNMPTCQLHAVSIVLLCGHFFGMKLQQELPRITIRMLQVWRPMDTTMKKNALPSLCVVLTMLSLFVLAIMTVYLAFLITFQGIMYVSSLISSNSISNSPVQCMIMLSFLPVLDYVLPWIFFGTGLYFAFSKTGFVWFMFSVSTMLVVFHGHSI